MRVPEGRAIPRNAALGRQKASLLRGTSIAIAPPEPSGRKPEIHVIVLTGTLEGNVIRIVLIEDDDLMREWLGRSLSSRGHEVDRYRRADQAIDAVAADPPDVIVSDVHMPGMSGIEFGKALRARGVPVPLIMMTADPSEALELHADAAGARCLLRKPFGDLSELWHAVEAAASAAPRSPGEEVTETSHALRTPLTAIRMALEALAAERVMDDRERHLADIAHRNLDRLTAALEEHLAQLSLTVEENSTAD
jgi:DNA-binding response OmpR family regulator